MYVRMCVCHGADHLAIGGSTSYFAQAQCWSIGI